MRGPFLDSQVKDPFDHQLQLIFIKPPDSMLSLRRPLSDQGGQACHGVVVADQVPVALVDADDARFAKMAPTDR
jgi:hypothetical protein